VHNRKKSFFFNNLVAFEVNLSTWCFAGVEIGAVPRHDYAALRGVLMAMAKHNWTRLCNKEPIKSSPSSLTHERLLYYTENPTN
jgi:hypothetical protein